MDSATPETLFTALRESGLYSAEQLAALDAIPAEVLADSTKLAEHLHRLDLLNAYQSRKVRINRIFELLFGEYLIIDKIGEGGMGKVYKAVQLRLGRIVALKSVRSQLMTDRRVLKRWKKEAKAVASLHHPNIVAMIDADESQGRHFMALEFVDGSDLSRLIKAVGALHYSEAAEYIRQAALGLQHAHNCSFVHRDIKPSNLLVSGDRALPGTTGQANVKILDMGLVRTMFDDDDVSQTELTRDGTVVGTPDYMSPEQARNSSTVDPRADIYSLGCTLFFLLNGRPPFPDGSPIDKLLRHRLDPPPDLRKLRPDVPEAMVLLVERMLAKETDDRVQSATEVAQYLAAFTPDVVPPVLLDAEVITGGTTEPTRDIFIPDGATIVTPAPPDTPTSPREVSPPKRRSAKPVRLTAPVADSDPAIVTRPQKVELPRAPTASSSDATPRAMSAYTREDDKPAARKKQARNRLVARKKTRNPIPLIAGSLGAVLLLVVAGIILTRDSGGVGGNTGPKIDNTPIVTPPVETVRRMVLAPAWINIPEATTAYLIAYPETYWPQEKIHPVKDRYTAALNRMTRNYRFEAQQADRLTFVKTDRAEGHFLAVAEGLFATPEWCQATESWRGAASRTVQQQKLTEFPGPSAPVFAATIPQRGILLSDDAELLASVVQRPTTKKPILGAGLLAALDDPIDPNRATLTFAANSRWKLPNGQALAELGVEQATIRAMLHGEEFHVSVSLLGNSRDELLTFLNITMFSKINELAPGVMPFARSIAENGSTQEFDMVNSRTRLRIAGTWAIADLHDWIEKLLPE